MRIAFMGTPEFSVAALKALISAGHDVIQVYTQPPRPAGRGKQPRPSPVHLAAEAAEIPVATPFSFRDPEVIAQFAALQADIAVVVAFGQILPPVALDAPRYGCLNIHASLLPRWRGAAPIQRAIMAGDAKTGVGIMQMEAGLDTGPVLAEARTAISPTDTAATLHDRLAAMGAELIVQTLADLPDLTPRPQSEDEVTYAAKIEKAEARIDWTRPAAEIDRQIRGLSPFPGAWCQINGDRVKLLMSRTVNGAGQSGQALDDTLTIACGDGAVRLLRLQRAGRGAQTSDELLRGFPIIQGTVLD
ncbi:MAG: methionyl-tRNA formyltransferase [Pseudomonadota bacterium]